MDPENHDWYRAWAGLASDKTDSVQNRIRAAIKKRWRNREKMEIFCSKDDLEWAEEFELDCKIFTSEQDYKSLEIEELRIDNIFHKTANDIGSKMDTISNEELVSMLRQIKFSYTKLIENTQDIEHAKKAKEDLIRLSNKANELALAMLELGKGSVDVLNRNYVIICGEKTAPSYIHFEDWLNWKRGESLPETRLETIQDNLSSIVDAGIVEEAEPFNLPGAIPWEPDEHEEEDGKYEYEWELGGPWIVRLRALAKLASIKANHIEEITGRGGRISFAARLHGSPDEWLAETCKDFVEAHGCHSQAAVLKMVQAIQEAEQGKEAMRAKDGKPSIHKGRKAVRKLVRRQKESELM